ncbi:MAG: 2-oxo acid dehydrogenase subunit E2 [Alphaproteobacteria bacterium]|nr:2-oxo acid dehydrogenase subunit E2 [Alphaproteobacteria bacterium]
MPNTELTLKRDVSSFRMIALGTWKTTKDPSVYGSLALEVDKALEYIEEFRAKTGRRLTLTHLMAKAVGMTLAEMPDANAILRFNRIYLRKDVDIFFQVMMTDPQTGQIDLSGLTIRHADQKSIVEIADEFQRVADRVRAGKDEEKEATRKTFKSLPGFAVGWILDLISILIYGLNLDLRRFGLPRDPFGSVMVTNIGSLGLEEAYVPLVPYSRVPLLLAMGSVKKEPVVNEETDAIEIKRVMRLFATFDHRVLDGAHAAKMSKTLKQVFADPWASFGAIPEGVAEAAEAS